MNRFVKKLFSLLAAGGLCGAVLLGAGGCHLIAGNYNCYGRLTRWDYADGFYACGTTAAYCRVDVVNKTYSESDEYELYTDGAEDGALTDGDVVARGGTAPHYMLELKEGYEGLETRLRALEESESAVIDCVAWLADGRVQGICNVYKDTAGYLSGGGNYAMEEIDYAVLFCYTAETDGFESMTLDGEMAAAWSGDTVLCWRDKGYYAHSLTDGSETFLVADEAYDSGLTHYSSGSVAFDEDYALFTFRKGTRANCTVYRYLYDFADGVLSELTEE